ncbi:MAG: hypothetical protein WCQ96_01040 [Patescibacteria group bacterium]
MEQQISRRTVKQCLPVINAVYAFFEVQIVAYENLEKKDELCFFHLEKDFGIPKLLSVGYIFGEWLEGSDFICNKLCIVKTNKKAKWLDFIRLLDKKINGYKVDTNIIEISLASNGMIFRNINGMRYSYDFKNDGLKKRIIAFLAEQNDFVQTAAIQKYVKSTNVKSFSDAVGQINSIMEQKLKLPKAQNLIKSKRGSGYRINPLYNIILTD